MKRSLTSCLILLLFCFTNCSEDELISSSYLSSTNLGVRTLSVSNPKVPVLTNVAINGSRVTLSFTNHAAPAGPEGGYELMLDGKRTKLEITDRVYATSKNVTMTFSVDDPASRTYQIYARWHSGYKSSNKLSGSNASDAPTSDEDKSTDTDPNEVKQPSNPKQPVISKVSFDGNTVNLEFVNFSAPSKPEGGYELMLDGRRTKLEITDRVNSSEKVLTMRFQIDHPEDHYYQIYARWHSGYISSEKFYPGQATPGDGEEEDDNAEEDNSSDSDNASTLPNMKLVKAYEFEDNIGRNVNYSQDGLKVHHLGREDGKVVSVDGVGAYRFRITPTGPKNSYRQELVPRDLPSPYFNSSNGFESNWNQEYIYEFRTKYSSDHQTGSGWSSFFSCKNDYTVNRQGSFTMHTFGDHYWAKQYYATSYTRNSNGSGSVSTHFDADGRELRPGTDFKETSGFGSGYKKVDSDINRWVKWAYHIKWSYSSNGFIRVYKNGKLFYAYDGPTSFKDDKAPYFKFGLYNSSWKQGDNTGSRLQEMFVDYVRVYVPK